MRKIYVPPEFEYIALSTPDCLTGSGETWTGPDYPENPGTGGSTDIGDQGGGGGWWGDP
ncbi:MAG: hypothetical protein PHT58_07700 [Eubacteriales bacterium]|nr:hypothetical protein [Eubacteriales bacterium]